MSLKIGTLRVTIAGWTPDGRMRLALKLACLMVVAAGSLHLLRAQELAPRAYIITPIHSNAVTVAYSYYNGSYTFGTASPITDATGVYSTPNITYYHGFNFFGRSANATVTLPYGVGNFQADLGGVQEKVYRSGLGDITSRISVNLMGGPAMPLEKFVKWKQKTLLGVSLKMVAPTGQYDPAKLVNWGTNRWAFKPELGYSRSWNKWVLDAYAGAWFFTTNSDFFSPTGPKHLTENPITAIEGHLSYDVKLGFWFSLDANFWDGGLSSLNGVPSPASSQRDSRIGATASFPLIRHQSVKFSYNNHDYARYGRTFTNLSVGWQYSWVGRPK